MAAPRAFISFDMDHNEDDKVLFAGQAKNSRTPFDIQDWSSKEQLPQNQWERIINEKINKCNFLIVLVGKYMTTATGAAKEIKMARHNNVPIFGVYVGGANNQSTLPEGLQRNRTIDWDWNEIASAISQMMREGKNVA